MSLGLYGLVDHAVREALSRLGGLVVHALRLQRQARFTQKVSPVCARYTS